jgi:hypothetical protein
MSRLTQSRMLGADGDDEFFGRFGMFVVVHGQILVIGNW